MNFMRRNCIVGCGYPIPVSQYIKHQLIQLIRTNSGLIGQDPIHHFIYVGLQQAVSVYHLSEYLQYCTK